MNAESALLQAYREWHRLALAETKAIQSRNWNLLADCQRAIKDFQAIVGQLTTQARCEWAAAGYDLAEKEQHVHVFVHELIELTRHNQALLQNARRTTRARLDQLEKARRNLCLLQRCYGNTTSGWSVAA